MGITVILWPCWLWSAPLLRVAGASTLGDPAACDELKAALWKVAETGLHFYAFATSTGAMITESTESRSRSALETIRSAVLAKSRFDHLVAPRNVVEVCGRNASIPFRLFHLLMASRADGRDRIAKGEALDLETHLMSDDWIKLCHGLDQSLLLIHQSATKREEAMGSVLSVCGNFSTALVLLTSDVLCSLVQTTSNCLVDVVDCVCGSGKNTVRKKIAWHEQRYSNAPVYSNEKPPGTSLGDLDVEKTMSQSKFPIAPAQLVKRAKEVLASEFGTARGFDGSVLAEDFQFVAPIVGPLSKKEFMQAFGSFKLKEAVPDLADNSWFQVDPLEPNRVWFFSRATGTHTGPLGNLIGPTGKRIELPPQAQSMLFNEKGECYTLTVGYCMDKRIGNSEGVGGVFGIVKAVGKPLPFPEGQRLYTPSQRYEAFERVAKAGETLGFGPNARNAQE